jgi:hypothetical protein
MNSKIMAEIRRAHDKIDMTKVSGDDLKDWSMV